MRLAVYALTRAGARLGACAARNLGGELFVPQRLAADVEASPFLRLPDLLRQTFAVHEGHVFVTAAGIAVRCVAPLLAGKKRDPAVVVLSQDGKYCLSLISGHLGGANELARRVASAVGAQPVITTASDLAGIPALDLLAVEAGLSWTDDPALARAQTALIEGDDFLLCDPENLLPELAGLPGVRAIAPGHGGAGAGPGSPGLWIHWRAVPEGAELAGLHPRRLAVGVGCRRGTPAREILSLVQSVFRDHGLAKDSILGLASITDKADEPGLLAAAATLGAPVRFYDRDQLGRCTVPTPSERVNTIMGVPSVCEAAAMTLAGTCTLPVRKTKSSKATVAVALAD